MIKPKDPNVRVDRSPGNLLITYRCNPAFGLFPWTLLAFFIILNLVPLSILIPFNSEGSNFPILRLWALWLVVNIYALPCLFGVLYLWFDKVTISATSEVIKLKMRPFPFQLDKTYSVAGAKQFFTRLPRRDIPGISKSILMISVEGYLVTIPARLPTGVAVNQVVGELQNFYGLKKLAVYGFTNEQELGEGASLSEPLPPSPSPLP
ncbi:MAG TPA: hypothetical protein VGL56_09745 [Fimbriimonadaceae bacterium]